ncbi:hypothetical protein SFRURICE_003757 [Spodoptera frugiperda]|nr:hypothetical protein SFRURICE_003757 [Spodoptera frugiperda]
MFVNAPTTQEKILVWGNVLKKKKKKNINILYATSRLLFLKVETEVHITGRNAAIQGTPTFRHLCYKSHIIGCEPIAIYWPQF